MSEHQLDRIERMLTELSVPAAVGMMRAEQVKRMTENLIAGLANEKTIEAIKEYRALTGHGLKESKDAIMAVINNISDGAKPYKSAS